MPMLIISIFRFIDTRNICCRPCNRFAIFVKFLNICKFMDGRLCCEEVYYGMIKFGGFRQDRERMSG
jgi:hypothetical protein